MSAQTPLPKDDPLMVAWEAHKATEQHATDVRWARVEAHTEGALWSAFEAGWRAREAALSAAGLVVEQGWQPIETAPRDAVAGGIWGPWLRLYRRGVVPLSGHWFHDSATRGWWVAAGKPFSPTHWRPIEAPQEDK